MTDTILYNAGLGPQAASTVQVTPTGGTSATLGALFSGAAAATGFQTSGSIVLTGTALVQESSTDNITAHAGGGKASATVLTTEVNRITTVATSGDSVLLPPSAAGLSIMINNGGANACQVFGAGTDTINGVATGTGVSQMANSEVIYVCPSAGNWEANGLGTGYSGSLETSSYVGGIVAHAGGGQGSATALTAMVNQLSTVATGGDSVVLPSLTLPSGVAAQIVVINNGAASANVFTPSGGTMNGTSNGSAALANATVGLYFCSGTNVWVSK